MSLYEILKTLKIIHAYLSISQSKLYDTPQKYPTYPPSTIFPSIHTIPTLHALIVSSHHQHPGACHSNPYLQVVVILKHCFLQ